MEKLRKGDHEKAMEKAKEMLDKGCGMGDIVEETKLSEENVMKAKRKGKIDRNLCFYIKLIEKYGLFYNY